MVLINGHLGKKEKIVNNMKKLETNLIKECKKAIRKEIAKQYYKESYLIIELTDDKNRNDFLKYHNEDKGNICCLVLDFAKQKLVTEGKLEQNKEDTFGKGPFILKDTSKNKELSEMGDLISKELDSDLLEKLDLNLHSELSLVLEEDIILDLESEQISELDPELEEFLKLEEKYKNEKQ